MTFHETRYYFKKNRFAQLVLTLSCKVYLQMSEMKVLWGEGSKQGQQMQHKTTLFVFIVNPSNPLQLVWKVLQGSTYT